MKTIKVNSIEALLQSIELYGMLEGFILLNGGAKSSKNLRSVEGQKGVVIVTNYIDDTIQTLTAQTLQDESVTNIGKAINSGAFFIEVPESEPTQ